MSYKKKKKPKNKGGRPRIVFTEDKWKEFENLCALQCTQLEITEWFGIDQKTFDKLLMKKYGKPFSLVFRQKRTKGLISLRRRQFQMSETIPSLAIFLGKNYLGQSDRQEIEHSGSIENKIRNMDQETRENRIKELESKLANR